MKRREKGGKVAAIIGQRASSSYTVAYNALLNAQKRARRRLRIQQVWHCLESTPGVVFPPGTTFDKILGKLETWQLIKIDGEYVSIRQ